MEIKIEKPFLMQLDVIETDDNIPSMKANVSIHVQQFLHVLEYQGSMWFDCASWDEFVSSLRRIGDTQARLTDMEGYLSLLLEARSEKREISWEMTKKDGEGNMVTAACRYHVDTETWADTKQQFTDFHRWW